MRHNNKVGTHEAFRDMMGWMPITPPIFVCTDDVLLFLSKEEAESSIEPVDVGPDERGYDAEGRLLRVLVRGEIRNGRWSVDQRRARVELVPVEGAASHREELRAHLSDWLQRADNATPNLANATLEELVERAKGVTRHHAGRDARRSKMIAWVIGVLAGVLAVCWWLIR